MALLDAIACCPAQGPTCSPDTNNENDPAVLLSAVTMAGTVTGTVTMAGTVTGTVTMAGTVTGTGTVIIMLTMTMIYS